MPPTRLSLVKFGTFLIQFKTAVLDVQDVMRTGNTETASRLNKEVSGCFLLAELGLKCLFRVIAGIRFFYF